MIVELPVAMRNKSKYPLLSAVFKSFKNGIFVTSSLGAVILGGVGGASGSTKIQV